MEKSGFNAKRCGAPNWARFCNGRHAVKTVFEVRDEAFTLTGNQSE
jgi:hypothetical protein